MRTIMFTDIEAPVFLTVVEVAHALRLSKMTVYRLIHAHELPAVRFGRSYRIPQEAATTFIHRAVLSGREEVPSHN